MVEGFGVTYSVSGDGKRTLGHHAELWRYRDGKLVLREAAQNVWEAGTEGAAEFR